MNIDEIKTRNEFLKFIKDEKITYKKLKTVVFGPTTIKVIKAVKKGGQDCFNALVKDHMIFWQIKFAVTEVNKIVHSH